MGLWVRSLRSRSRAVVSRVRRCRAWAAQARDDSCARLELTQRGRGADPWNSLLSRSNTSPPAWRSTLAARASRVGVVEGPGAASPEENLARRARTSTAEAKETLATSKKLPSSQKLADTFARGSCRSARANEISSAAAVNPAAEGDLVETAGTRDLRGLRDECRKARAAADRDPEATNRRAVHASRYFRHGYDFRRRLHRVVPGRPQIGCPVRSRSSDRSGTPPTAKPAKRAAARPFEALDADALMAMAEASQQPVSRSSSPRHQVHVLVDHEALVRGHTEPGRPVRVSSVAVPVSWSTRMPRRTPSSSALCSSKGVEVAEVTASAGACPAAIPRRPPGPRPRHLHRRRAAAATPTSRSTTNSPTPKAAPPPTTTSSSSASNTTATRPPPTASSNPTPTPDPTHPTPDESARRAGGQLDEVLHVSASSTSPASHGGCPSCPVLRCRGAPSGSRTTSRSCSTSSRSRSTSSAASAPTWSAQRVFGGQVAGQALVAAGRTVDRDDRRVHSLHAYFLRPGDPTVPIVYEVDRIRDGRSFTTRRVVPSSTAGRSSTSRRRSTSTRTGFDHQLPMPDDVPAPTTLPDFQHAHGRRGPTSSATGTTGPGRSTSATSTGPARPPASRAAAPAGLVPGRRHAARRPGAAHLRRSPTRPT